MRRDKDTKSLSGREALHLRGLLGFKETDRIPEPGLDRLLHGGLVVLLLHRLNGLPGLVKWNVMARHS